MLEYASIRFMFSWVRATTLPRVMVTRASNPNTSAHSILKGSSTNMITRKAAAKAMAFGHMAMKALTVVGAPSYVSGTHMWNGTAVSSKPNPAIMKTRPRRARDDGSSETTCFATKRLVVPVLP